MRYVAESVCWCGVIALSACSGNPRPAQIAKAEPVLSETGSASEAIAEARCDREARCNNVGPDKRYSSLEDCMTRVWTEWPGDFDVRQCQFGVNSASLDECLTEIRVLECSSRLESLERLPACAPHRICAN